MKQELTRVTADTARDGADGAFRRLHPLSPLGLRPAACLAARRPGSACDRCAAACPHQCLSPAEDGPALDPTRCSACGICAAACPTGALAVDGITLPAAVPALGLTLACERSRSALPPSTHRVACLGALALNDWLRLALAAGDAPVRTMDDGACATCDNAAAHDAPWRNAIDLARRALTEAGMPAHRLPDAADVHALPSGNAANAGAPMLESRRRFFSGLSRSLAKAFTDPACGEPPGSPGNPQRHGHPVLAQRGTETRLLLLQVARRSGTNHPRTALLPALSASDACRIHGACSRVCPTGALQLETDGDPGYARLSFDAWLCVDCDACTRICPSHALTFQARAWRPYVHAPVVLATREQGECVRCGALFHAHDEETLCERCRKTEDLARAGLALFSRRHRDGPAAPEGP